MGQYDSQIKTAKALLAKFGETSSLVRTLGGTPPDATKPWEPGAPVVTTTKVSAVWLQRSILRDESLVKEGESFVILAASDLKSAPDPSVDHLVRADKTRYSVAEVLPLDPNGQAIIYELKVRR